MIAHPTKSLHTALSHKVNEACVLKYYGGVQAVENEKVLPQGPTAETDVKSNRTAKEQDEKSSQKVNFNIFKCTLLLGTFLFTQLA